MSVSTEAMFCGYKKIHTVFVIICALLAQYYCLLHNIVHLAISFIFIYYKLVLKFIYVGMQCGFQYMSVGTTYNAL